jgi:hypothetical protein
MINKTNIVDLLKELDKALEAKDESREITIFGSGALIIQGISNNLRATMDIDIVDPEMDITLQLICADVGEKYDLDMTWLNSAGHIFSRSFPSGWKKRINLIYKGRSLKVSSIHRSDLIATKFYAICTRSLETDRLDLKDLKPSEEELNQTKKWVESQKDYNDIKDLVLETFNYFLNLSTSYEEQ